MTFHGPHTELAGDTVWTDPDRDLSDVVVTPDRIAVDWAEDDDVHLNVVLYPHDDARQPHSGRIATREHPTADGYASVWRYDLKGGGILLRMTWQLDALDGFPVVERERHGRGARGAAEVC